MSDSARHDRPLRLAILQRVIPEYRVSFFERLSSHPSLDVQLFIGEDLPDSKVRSAQDLGLLAPRRIPTGFVRLPGRRLPLHHGLITELRAFRPDVILCEGESHFLGYLQAMWYRFRSRRRVGLIHWCFIGLPGEGDFRHPVASVVKSVFRRRFDAFLLYSNYSRERLVRLGEPVEKMFVATNVGDVGRFLEESDALTLTRQEARAALGLPERPTVLYTGTLDANKRPEVMIQLARALPDRSFVLLGDGPLGDVLRAAASNTPEGNAYLPGRVSETLPTYYRAADLMVIPGRGGIVISEAMASGLPVVVHHADGTEFDLVRNDETGVRLEDGSVQSFLAAVERLTADMDALATMGEKAREHVRSTMNQAAMVDAVFRASRYAFNARTDGEGGRTDPSGTVGGAHP